MDSIFKYLDYREFLRDHFDHNKSCHRYFSFRYVAGKTGLDASFYVKVLNKQKHIANSAIPVLIGFCKLSKREGAYFSLLVHYNKAKTPDQEAFFLQKLLLLRKPVATVIENELYEYLTSWWNVVLREELNVIQFKGDYEDLAKRLQPPISEQQARQSVKLLESLNLIRQTEGGTWKPTHEFLTTDGSDLTKAVRAYQKSVLKLAALAIDSIPKEERDFSTLTISTSRKGLETIRERLIDIRREIIELVRKEETTEEVYQINFEIFPLTRNNQK
ncbi:MAG: TIGR02147 family protein [Chitinispirillaceae bacterium]|nr:TIGR02147 family protein [Chitinispirillaceae bacterium]